MKILIMVQACAKPPYDKLQEAQRATWDSVNIPEVTTGYYFCDQYNLMHVPFRETLKDIMHLNYDFIFRTNASSYVDKKMLLEKARTLPKEKCYCGIDGGGYASGAGVFISTDLIPLLIDGLLDDVHGAEDVYIGQVLESHGIKVTPGADRYEFNHKNDQLRRVYHYRCKSDTEDRNKDIIAFHKVHKFIHG